MKTSFLDLSMFLKHTWVLSYHLIALVIVQLLSPMKMHQRRQRYGPQGCRMPKLVFKLFQFTETSLMVFSPISILIFSKKTSQWTRFLSKFMQELCLIPHHSQRIFSTDLYSVVSLSIQLPESCLDQLSDCGETERDQNT